MNIFKRLFKSKNKHSISQDQPSIGGYVFWHNRATDTILIGPFESVQKANLWYEEHGRPLGVSSVLTHIRYPANTYNGIWGLFPEEQFIDNLHYSL